MPPEATLASGQLPLWLKIAYTAFLAVLVPFYWHQYTPLNFLWFCDVALLLTLPALWLENKLLASMQVVAITIPQLLWIVDFLGRLIAGISIIGMTDYMFDEKNLLFTRGLSLFHGWLPLMLLWMVWKLGYDPRAFPAQVLLGWLVLLLSYFLTTSPTGPAGNVNKVFGPGETEVQTWMDPRLWLATLMAFYPICFYLPTHLLARWLAPR